MITPLSDSQLQKFNDFVTLWDLEFKNSDIDLNHQIKNQGLEKYMLSTCISSIHYDEGKSCTKEEKAEFLSLCVNYFFSEDKSTWKKLPIDKQITLLEIASIHSKMLDAKIAMEKSTCELTGFVSNALSIPFGNIFSYSSCGIDICKYLIEDNPGIDANFLKDNFSKELFNDENISKITDKFVTGKLVIRQDGINYILNQATNNCRQEIELLKEFLDNSTVNNEGRFQLPDFTDGKFSPLAELLNGITDVLHNENLDPENKIHIEKEFSSIKKRILDENEFTVKLLKDPKECEKKVADTLTAISEASKSFLKEKTDREIKNIADQQVHKKLEEILEAVKFQLNLESYSNLSLSGGHLHNQISAKLHDHLLQTFTSKLDYNKRILADIDKALDLIKLNQQILDRNQVKISDKTKQLEKILGKLNKFKNHHDFLSSAIGFSQLAIKLGKTYKSKLPSFIKLTPLGTVVTLLDIGNSFIQAHKNSKKIREKTKLENQFSIQSQEIGQLAAHTQALNTVNLFQQNSINEKVFHIIYNSTTNAASKLIAIDKQLEALNLSLKNDEDELIKRTGELTVLEKKKETCGKNSGVRKEAADAVMAKKSEIESLKLNIDKTKNSIEDVEVVKEQTKLYRVLIDINYQYYREEFGILTDEEIAKLSESEKAEYEKRIAKEEKDRSYQYKVAKDHCDFIERRRADNFWLSNSLNSLNFLGNAVQKCTGSTTLAKAGELALHMQEVREKWYEMQDSFKRLDATINDASNNLSFSDSLKYFGYKNLINEFLSPSLGMAGLLFSIASIVKGDIKQPNLVLNAINETRKKFTVEIRKAKDDIIKILGKSISQFKDEIKILLTEEFNQVNTSLHRIEIMLLGLNNRKAINMISAQQSKTDFFVEGKSIIGEVYKIQKTKFKLEDLSLESSECKTLPSLNVLKKFMFESSNTLDKSRSKYFNGEEIFEKTSRFSEIPNSSSFIGGIIKNLNNNNLPNIGNYTLYSALAEIFITTGKNLTQKNHSNQFKDLQKLFFKDKAYAEMLNQGANYLKVKDALLNPNTWMSVINNYKNISFDIFNTINTFKERELKTIADAKSKIENNLMDATQNKLKNIATNNFDTKILGFNKFILSQIFNSKFKDLIDCSRFTKLADAPATILTASTLLLGLSTVATGPLSGILLFSSIVDGVLGGVVYGIESKKPELPLENKLCELVSSDFAIFVNRLKIEYSKIIEEDKLNHVRLEYIESTQKFELAFSNTNLQPAQNSILSILITLETVKAKYYVYGNEMTYRELISIPREPAINKNQYDKDLKDYLSSYKNFLLNLNINKINEVEFNGCKFNDSIIIFPIAEQEKSHSLVPIILPKDFIESEETPDFILLQEAMKLGIGTLVYEYEMMPVLNSNLELNYQLNLITRFEFSDSVKFKYPDLSIKGYYTSLFRFNELTTVTYRNAINEMLILFLYGSHKKSNGGLFNLEMGLPSSGSILVANKSYACSREFISYGVFNELQKNKNKTLIYNHQQYFGSCLEVEERKYTWLQPMSVLHALIQDQFWNDLGAMFQTPIFEDHLQLIKEFEMSVSMAKLISPRSRENIVSLFDMGLGLFSPYSLDNNAYLKFYQAIERLISKKITPEKLQLILNFLKNENPETFVSDIERSMNVLTTHAKQYESLLIQTDDNKTHLQLNSFFANNNNSTNISVTNDNHFEINSTNVQKH